MKIGVACLLVASALAARAVAAEEPTDAWAALTAGGHVALVRHGNAPPGHGGDPPGFRIDDCRTQRNLDELGREQARALGGLFRERGVRVDRVVSSPWCRCLETARLLALGPVGSSWSLVPDLDERRPARLRDLREMIAAWSGPGTLVLVAHALTARPLVGFLPGQAETVVLKPAPGSTAGATVVGRIGTPR